MLLRTVPLLLCVAMGMCATIGHHQTQAMEEEEVVDSAAVTDGVVAAASVDAAEEDVASVDTRKGNSPAAEEPVANSFFGDNLLAKIVALGNPEADKPEVDVLVADSDRPAGDDPAVDALAREAVDQEQPFVPKAEEEEHDIKPVQTNQSQNAASAQEDNNSWSLNSIRNSFQTMHGYFDSLVELAGGYNGVCQYRCRYGEAPKPRPGYQIPEPNGCSSSLVGFQLDLGIPAMTSCCNKLDMCYDTCGTSKTDCDSEFRLCLHNICSNIKKSLGFASKVQACESMADALHGTVGTLGCRPYMNSQRAACVCEEEERDEL